MIIQKPEISIGLDWLALVLPNAYVWDDYETPDSILPVLEWLTGIRFDAPEWKVTRKGAVWYRHRHTIHSSKGQPLIHIGTEPTAENNRSTTTLTLTGYALSDRPDALQDVDPIQVLTKVFELGGQPSRIDLALDYFGSVPIHQLMLAASKPDVWKDQITTPLRFKAPLPIGWEQTLYYGELKKGTVVCAYDKAAEQGVPGNWERIELRTTNKDLLIPLMMDLTGGVSLGEVTTGILWKYLRFIQPGPKAKNNRPPAQWWVDLLAGGKGDYVFKRHSDGKIEETGTKAKRSGTGATVRAYLDRQRELDNTGDIEAVILQIADEIRAGNMPLR